MKVKVNVRELLARNADHSELLLFHGGVEIDDLLDTNGVEPEQEVDLHRLLAQQRAIALIWDADMLVSTYPHLSSEQAWQALQECERHYTAESGLSWDDVAGVVTELFPDPADLLHERVSRFGQALSSYDREEFGAAHTLADLLADARHWCDAKELDFSDVNGRAYQHYLAEREGKEARP